MIEIENIYKNNFKDIEKIDTSNMEAIQNELNNMFNKMETKAYKMDQSLQPYKELYEKNQKDADVLWQNLIIKYPNLSVEDIKDEI
jgi:predicted ribosome quality control (RQC) complex YloA/Tae2 family protein